MKYQIKHKLTGKVVLDSRTLKAMTFETKEEAQKVVDMKDRVMGAGFYEIVEPTPLCTADAFTGVLDAITSNAARDRRQAGGQ